MCHQPRIGHHIELFVSSSLVVLSFFFLLGPSQLEAGPIYSLQNLGSIGSGAGAVTAINSSGTVVGFVTNATGNQTPVAFNGSAQVLSSQAQGQANGINSTGTVVGTYSPNNQSPSVAEWSNGQMTNLGITGYGTAINDSGQIAGAYQTATGDLHAFTLAPGGKLVDLGTLGGTWSSAYAINASGQIAGTSTLATGAYNAFFDTGSQMTDLGTLGGRNSYGLAMNDLGEVVGNAQTSQQLSNAFAWINGKMTDLGTLGGSQSYAYGVNDSGTIVGYSWITGNTATNGFIVVNGVMIDLNSLLPAGSGWTIDAAYAINNAGDIAAIGTYDGQQYAVELIPGFGDFAVAAVPEPEMLLLTGIGLIVVGRVARGRILKASASSAGGHRPIS